MAKPVDGSARSCPNCQARGPSSWLGARELLLGAAALGLVFGLGAVAEDPICERLDDHPAAIAERDTALDSYIEDRCGDGRCESIDVVSSAPCRAKVRVIERRVDEYGDELGTFRVDEGLSFSPVLGRWRVREVLVDKQVLGSRSR